VSAAIGGRRKSNSINIPMISTGTGARINASQKLPVKL